MLRKDDNKNCVLTVVSDFFGSKLLQDEHVTITLKYDLRSASQGKITISGFSPIGHVKILSQTCTNIISRDPLENCNWN